MEGWTPSWHVGGWMPEVRGWAAREQGGRGSPPPPPAQLQGVPSPGLQTGILDLECGLFSGIRFIWANPGPPVMKLLSWSLSSFLFRSRPLVWSSCSSSHSTPSCSPYPPLSPGFSPSPSPPGNTMALLLDSLISVTFQYILVSNFTRL